MLAEFFQFIGYVWQGITGAMRLNPNVFAVVESLSATRWIVLTIAILGGASLLLGQSAILFVNRVRPARFILSLILSGILFMLNLIVWGLSIWATAHLFFDAPPSAGVFLRMVALGAAPYIFGFLILMPYLGNFVSHVLAVWSFLIVLSSTIFLIDVPFTQGLVIVGLGWVFVQVLGATIGRPLSSLSKWLQRIVAGTAMDARVQDVLLDLISDEPTKPPASSQTE